MKTKDSYTIILGHLNEERQKAMREKAAEYEAGVKEYDRLYYIQLDGYIMHNRKFGKQVRAMTPQSYEKFFEDKLRQEAQAALEEQRAEELVKGQEREDTVETDLQKQQDQEKENEQEQEQEEEKDSEVDPRILAFRERMAEMDRENERNKEKGYEYE